MFYTSLSRISLAICLIATMLGFYTVPLAYAGTLLYQSNNQTQSDLVTVTGGNEYSITQTLGTGIFGVLRSISFSASTNSTHGPSVAEMRLICTNSANLTDYCGGTIQNSIVAAGDESLRVRDQFKTFYGLDFHKEIYPATTTQVYVFDPTKYYSIQVVPDTAYAGEGIYFYGSNNDNSFSGGSCVLGGNINACGSVKDIYFSVGYYDANDGIQLISPADGATIPANTPIDLCVKYFSNYVTQVIAEPVRSPNPDPNAPPTLQTVPGTYNLTSQGSPVTDCRDSGLSLDNGVWKVNWLLYRASDGVALNADTGFATYYVGTGIASTSPFGGGNGTSTPFNTNFNCSDAYPSIFGSIASTTQPTGICVAGTAALNSIFTPLNKYLRAFLDRFSLSAGQDAGARVASTTNYLLGSIAGLGAIFGGGVDNPVSDWLTLCFTIGLTLLAIAATSRIIRLLLLR